MSRIFGGEDPKEKLISVLEDEVQFLRRKLEERDRYILSLTSPPAFRLNHPQDRSKEPPPTPVPPTPYEARLLDHTPRLSLAKLEASFIKPDLLD